MRKNSFIQNAREDDKKKLIHLTYTLERVSKYFQILPFLSNHMAEKMVQMKFHQEFSFYSKRM